MPFKREKIKLDETQDRRVKLLACQKLAIIKMFSTGLHSINGLSRAWKVNKRLIQFILYPDRALKNRQDRAERGGSKVYYDRSKNTEAVKNTRRYKQNLYIAKELSTQLGKNCLPHSEITI